MLAIREHISFCDTCREEYEGLSETKRLVASLAFRAPRADLENLLLRDAERATRGYGVAGAASRLWEWFVPGRESTATPPSQPPLYLRPRPMVATLLLSVAGIWMASAAVDVPGDNGGVGVPGGGEIVDAPQVSQVSVVLVSAPSTTSPSGGMWIAVAPSQPSASTVAMTSSPNLAGAMSLPAAASIATPVVYGGASQTAPVSQSSLSPVSLSGMGAGMDTAASLISSVRRRWAVYNSFP